MPSPISSAAHYLYEKEKYKELILDNVSFDNNIDFYSGINDFKKKTHVELIEYFVTNYNEVNGHNIKYPNIDAALFISSMTPRETAIFANKIRAILREQLSAFWRDYVNDLVYFIENDASEDFIRHLYKYCCSPDDNVIYYVGKVYNEYIVEYGGISRTSLLDALRHIPRDELKELEYCVTDAIYERHKKL